MEYRSRNLDMEIGVDYSSDDALKKKFTTVAFVVLLLNLLVILWGAVVRATGSGAGCGSHWPLCNGEVVPLAPEFETLIEFTHRLSSGLAFLGVIGLVLFARRVFAPKHAVRRYAIFSLIFITVESLIGAGLVLFELVGANASSARAIVVSIHLLNTLILLGFLTLTWWRAYFTHNENQPAVDPFPSKTVLVTFAVFIVLVGLSGAIAALGNTLFPSQSLIEGIQKDLDRTSHFLIRLRVFHPFFALIGAGFVLSLIYSAMEKDTRPIIRRLGWMVMILGVLQLGTGLITLILLAPVWMQIVHLLIADLLWMVFVVYLDTKRLSYP